jgi:hypothetical protein
LVVQALPTVHTTVHDSRTIRTNACICMPYKHRDLVDYSRGKAVAIRLLVGDMEDTLYLPPSSSGLDILPPDGLLDLGPSRNSP